MPKHRRKRNEDEVQIRKPFHIQAKNYKQEALLEAIDNNVITVAIGCAGTGKTFCTGMKVAQLFLKGGYDRIILTRANVPTGRSLGHFPGTVQEKMEPWLAPITNVLKEGMGKGHYEYLVRKDKIQVQPIETIRGNSYNDALVIVDEAQNLSIEEIKAITTRIGENSKMILTGDPAQSDVKDGNDLIKFVQLCFENHIEIPIIEFCVNDIVRSDIVAKLVRMFINNGV